MKWIVSREKELLLESILNYNGLMAKFDDILLVEDDPITVMVCERVIKMNSFADRVTSCENGKIALDYLSYAHKENPNHS